MKRALLLIGLVVLSSPASADEMCGYLSNDGLKVEFIGDDQIRITSGDESRQCEVYSPNEFRTTKAFRCRGGFTGDLFLIPSTPAGDFPDIIMMPPNVLYYSCWETG
jgi:hypothetical protein